MTRTRGTLHEQQYTFFIISRMLPTMRNISDKTEEKIKTHTLG